MKMNDTVTHYLSHLKLSAAQVFNNITLLPVMGPDPKGPGYLTLGEALQQQLLSITEMSQQGRVPELQVHSRADKPVLLLDGEELMGAKQNRVLNTTILLKENAATTIPVSCTERGRWAYTSSEFKDSGVVMSRKARAQKVQSVSDSLAQGHKHSSDQGEVWAQIEHLSDKAGTASPTQAMQDVFKAREAELAQCLITFKPVANQVGLLVLIDNQPVGFDVVSQPAAYAQLHAKLVKSYVIDALVEGPTPKIPPVKPLPQARQFLEQAMACDESAVPAIGHGQSFRYQHPGLAGTALIHEDQGIHLAFFQVPEKTEAPPSLSSLRRRRFFRE